MDTKYLEIIKAPVITEKSQNAMQNGQYTFKVDPKANKKRVGRYTGLTNRSKKAIVTLAEGQTIELG